ncbi:MAG: thioesterase family protein [Desulfobacterales bacterium]|nr:thioesterase family protein [Desulfobacterales bacterium]
MDTKIVELEPILNLLKDVYENQMPFNKLLGIKILSLELDKVCVRVDMKEEFIGNFTKNILHGGVISSVLDLTGGLVASMGVLKQIKRATSQELVNRFSKIGTIDLRVDYLRAGQGDYFLTTGYILRTGNKVAVVRTEFKNHQDILIAAGTGSYIIG